MGVAAMQTAAEIAAAAAAGTFTGGAAAPAAIVAVEAIFKTIGDQAMKQIVNMIPIENNVKGAFMAAYSLASGVGGGGGAPTGGLDAVTNSVVQKAGLQQSLNPQQLFGPQSTGNVQPLGPQTSAENQL